jgi:hypothetical protein
LFSEITNERDFFQTEIARAFEQCQEPAQQQICACTSFLITQPDFIINTHINQRGEDAGFI